MQQLPTLAPTAVPITLTATIPPTNTPAAVATANAPATPSPQATTTSQPTADVSPSPTTAALADRPCPDPPPLKPAYNRFYLAAAAWPTPDTGVTLPHFWLSPPFAGSDRLLTNQSYPYGSDGDGRYLLHNGVDAAEPMGTPLLAVADGTVVVAQTDQNELYGWRCDWYGQLVVIELNETWQGQPIYVLYGHVLNIEVEAGERVERGQPLAEVGVGGVATVPHLHLEVRVGSNDFNATRNPMLWLHPGRERGLIVGRLVDPEGRPWQGVTVTLIDADADPQFTNTWTYLDDPQHLIHPDEGWAENFVFADVRPGDQVVYAKVQGVEYRVPVQVRAEEASVVEIVTEPYKTLTPTPAVTAPTPSPEGG